MIFNEYNDYYQEFKLLSNKIYLIDYTKVNNNIIFNCKTSTNIDIKLTTNFDKFCYLEIDNIDYMDKIKLFNLYILFKKKKLQNIIDLLHYILFYDNNDNNNDNNNDIILNDPFNFYKKIDNICKHNIDYIYYEKLLNDVKIIKKVNNTIFTTKQINKLLIEEIKTINNNNKYKHYIIIDENNPYKLIIRLLFDDNNILNEINNKYNYNYVELSLTINPELYPLIPPKINYIKPNISYDLLIGLLDLNIFKLENWNLSITLEYLIINIAEMIETIGYKYINIDNILNNNNLSFDKLDYNIIKLLCISKNIDNINKVELHIDIPKKSINKMSKYWKSGTGYGTDDQIYENVDILYYYNNLQKHEIQIILETIFNIIIDNKNKDNKYIINSIPLDLLLIYICKQIDNINILEIENNRQLYKYIFYILKAIVYDLDNNNIIKISKYMENIHEELDFVINKSNNLNLEQDILTIYSTIDTYINIYTKYNTSTNIIENCNISDDIKQEYCNIMKKLQFKNIELLETHKFYNNKNNKPFQTSLIRILSEISSFKKNLPLNWESTIWVGISKNNYNIFSFLISGPKDTPYENGIFEFHGYFPVDYPNTVPEVLLNTTGNNTVRFNPNLYNNGKVCLSLLNTWSGRNDEKWNPKMSTFLQVMISIQSLILIDEPYFNEPGWEKQMNTDNGNNKSKLYNEELYQHTIKYAMIDILNNPPKGFEDIIINHFKFKKVEIINTLNNWINNSDKYKMNIKNNSDELFELLNKL